jgi:hypothetical protein
MVRLRNIVIVVLTAMVTTANAQKDVTGFLNYGIDNARVLSEQYLMPHSKMISSALIQDFEATARVKHLGGVDLKMGINYSFVPVSDYLFDVNDMISSGVLSNISLVSGSVEKAPTVANRFLQGQHRPVLEYGGEENEMPNGSDFSSMMSPVVSVSVGIALNTEIGLNYMLPFGSDNAGDALMFGAAVKHSLKNYFPFLRRSPFLQVALTGNYSKYSSSIDVSYRGQTGQELSIDASGYGGGLLAGMDFPAFGFTGKVGYAVTRNTFSLDGVFSGIPSDGDISSPDLITYDDGFMNYGIGVFFRFYRLRISGNYTYGLYSTINAALAFEFGH